METKGMPRMLGRIKYRLLKLLLDDICTNSDCHDCKLGSEIEIAGYFGKACGEDDIFSQARKVWGMEDCYGRCKDL